jgi:N-acetylneuraminic acid mutarotase
MKLGNIRLLFEPLLYRTGMHFPKVKSATPTPLGVQFHPALILLVFAACLCTGTALVNAQSATGTWSRERPLPAQRAEVAVVALNGWLHTIGGNRYNVAVTAHDAYNPKTNTWRKLANLPEPRDHVGVAAYGDKIFAIGGFATPVHKNASAEAFEYDAATDTWRKLPAMMVARGSPGAATLDGKIHVIGGRGDDGVTLATHEVYDPKTNRWSSAAPLPQARDHLAIVAVDGKIHVIGGRRGSGLQRVARHDVYDPKMNQWVAVLSSS